VVRLRRVLGTPGGAALLEPAHPIRIPTTPAGDGPSVNFRHRRDCGILWLSRSGGIQRRAPGFPVAETRFAPDCCAFVHMPVIECRLRFSSDGMHRRPRPSRLSITPAAAFDVPCRQKTRPRRKVKGLPQGPGCLRPMGNRRDVMLAPQQETAKLSLRCCEKSRAQAKALSSDGLTSAACVGRVRRSGTQLITSPPFPNALRPPSSQSQIVVGC